MHKMPRPNPGNWRGGCVPQKRWVVLSDHPKSVSDFNHLHNIAFKSCREINKLTPSLEVAVVVFFRFSTMLKKIRKKGLYVKQFIELYVY